MLWVVVALICFQFIIVSVLSTSSTPSNIVYLMNGSFIILVLVIALKKIQNLISTYPEIRKSHSVMRVHMWLFIFE